jgi:hypothetical protein
MLLIWVSRPLLIWVSRPPAHWCADPQFGTLLNVSRLDGPIPKSRPRAPLLNVSRVQEHDPVQVRTTRNALDDELAGGFGLRDRAAERGDRQSAFRREVSVIGPVVADDQLVVGDVREAEHEGERGAT